MVEDSRVGHLIGAWWRDVRYGLRSIRKTAPLSVALVATLVVGVGMNAVVFSIFNGLMFRPVVTRDPATYVQVYVRLSAQWHRELHGPPSLATLEDLEIARRATHSLVGVTASRWASFTLGDNRTVSLRGKFVSCDYLSAHLGAMRAGRGFVEEDCARGSCWISRRPIRSPLRRRSWSSSRRH